MAGVFLVGRHKILPNTIDSYGIGTSFAIDSKSYRIEAANLADNLRRKEISTWLSHPRLHVKLYSLCFLILEPVLGANILSAEPLNLICFLLIVILVYSLGTEIFDETVGILAAATVMLWPSFLLHTTQMLRDPLFIAGFLLLILIFVRLLSRRLSAPQGALAGVIGSFTVLSLWLIRGDWWELIFAVVLMGIALPILKQMFDRRFRLGNVLACLLILGAGLFLPKLVPAYRQSDEYLSQSASSKSALTPPTSTGTRLKEGPDFWNRVPKRISLLRHRFSVRYPKAGSNIDANVELNGVHDLISYFPRAMAIGLLSPFPNMWFSRGVQVGRVGRLVAGAEMLGMYLILGLALVCAIFQRRRLSVWLLLGTVLVATIALGYVVVNVSTIYRMRYVFTMLLIVLGAKGLIEIKTRLAARNAVAAGAQSLP